MTDSKNFMALDVGAARIGVAVAQSVARLPRPLTTLSNDSDVLDTIADLVRNQEVGQLVIGLPRGLEGQETEQTKAVRAFGEKLRAKLSVDLRWQDEAVTSVQAENELQQARKAYTKSDIDARAAVLILEDFLKEQA